MLNKNSKVLIGLAAVLVIALPLMSAFAAEDNGQETIELGRGEKGQEKLNRFLFAQNLPNLRQRRSLWFLKGAEKAMFGDVTIVGMLRNILIVQHEEGYLNFVMPDRWYDQANEVIIDLEEMFTEIKGSTLDLQVLKRTVTNESRVSLTIYFCYKINGYHAALPYNIDGEE